LAARPSSARPINSPLEAENVSEKVDAMSLSSIAIL
jgi:hypothetical protein